MGRSSPYKGHSRPYLLWPNGWMDEDATEYRSRTRPGHIVLTGDPSFPVKGTQQPALFSAHVYCGHGRPSQLLLRSFVSDIAIFVLKRDVKLQLTNCCALVFFLGRGLSHPHAYPSAGPVDHTPTHDEVFWIRNCIPSEFQLHLRLCWWSPSAQRQ